MKKNSNKAIPTKCIAPCGMNCRLCRAYKRPNKPCPTCRGDDSLKSKACLACKIKNCKQIASGKVKYCFKCDNFPCRNLLHLDKRYRTTYGMSMIENLIYIREHGIRAFVRNEKKRWACPQCGDLLCVHKAQCGSCGHTWRS